MPCSRPGRPREVDCCENSEASGFPDSRGSSQLKSADLTSLFELAAEPLTTHCIGANVPLTSSPRCCMCVVQPHNKAVKRAFSGSSRQWRSAQYASLKGAGSVPRRFGLRSIVKRNTMIGHALAGTGLDVRVLENLTNKCVVFGWSALAIARSVWINALPFRDEKRSLSRFATK